MLTAAPLPRTAHHALTATGLRELEVDFTFVDDHIDQPHAQMIAEPERAPAARADHAEAGTVA
jgi:hypothetical protein